MVSTTTVYVASHPYNLFQLLRASGLPPCLGITWYCSSRPTRLECGVTLPAVRMSLSCSMEPKWMPPSSTVCMHSAISVKYIVKAAYVLKLLYG